MKSILLKIFHLIFGKREPEPKKAEVKKSAAVESTPEIQPEEKRIPKKRRLKAEKPLEVEKPKSEFEMMLEESYKSMESDLRRFKVVESAQDSRSRFRKPSARIDLHGLKSDEAIRRVRTFILTSRADQRKSIRIITGKGKHSEGESVLKNVVADELIKLKRRGVVKSHRWEKGSKKRSGSVLIHL